MKKKKKKIHRCCCWNCGKNEILEPIKLTLGAVFVDSDNHRMDCTSKQIKGNINKILAESEEVKTSMIKVLGIYDKDENWIGNISINLETMDISEHLINGYHIGKMEIGE